MCKWWQRHQWKMWEYHKEAWQKQMTYNGMPVGNAIEESRTYGERVCLRCGYKERKRLST